MQLLSRILRETIVPVLTPLNKDGSFVFEGPAEAHLEFLWDAGVRRFFMNPGFARSPALDDVCWRSVVRFARKTLPKEAIVLANVSALSTEGSIRRAAMAVELGADAVVSTLPIGRQPAGNGAAISHFRAIAEIMPLVLYANAQSPIPVFVGMTLATDPAVIGIKTSTRVWSEVEDFLGMENFDVVMGNEALARSHFLGPFAGSVAGVVPSGANVDPKRWVDFFSAVDAGDLKTVAAINERLNLLANMLHHGIWGDKEAESIMTAMGLRGTESHFLPGPVDMPNPRMIRDRIDTMKQLGYLK